MSTSALAQTPEVDYSAIETVIAKGDLSKLTPEERVSYYVNTCRSIGRGDKRLNPMTRPFEFLNLGGKTVLYANRGCTDQLRDIYGVNILPLQKERQEDLYFVTAIAELPDGRRDTATGIVAVAGLKGEALANALMKAETKAKRRVTLSICGLGWMDETEAETIPGARTATQYMSELANVTIDADGNTRIVDVASAPVDDEEVRERRMRFLHVVAKEVGLSHDDLREKAREWYGVGSMREMSVDQLGRMIEQLQVLRSVAGDKGSESQPEPDLDDEPIEAQSRTLDDDDDLAETAALMDEIDGAQTSKEVNTIYKRALDAGIGPKIHGHYEKRLAELRNGN